MRRVTAVTATLMIVSNAFSREACSQSSSAVAQQGLESSTKNGSWSSQASAIVGYDSNAFRLSDRSVDRLKLGQPADDLSGRFRDMNEVDDAMLDLDLAFLRKGVGLDGRDLDFVFEVGADLYSANSIKNSPHIEVEAIQDLAKGSELRARIGYEYGRFRRNYLYDATDLTGRVTEEERVYRSGKFNQLAAAVEHRFRLWRKKKKQESLLQELGLRELECRIEASVGRRQYDNFANRDRDILSVQMQLVSRIGKDWRVDLSYRGRYIDTPGGTEVLVLDEDAFDVDFNGDGDANDNNRRTEQRVDRDRIDHRLAAELRWQFTKSSECRLGYELMLQDYLSNEPFDLNNNGRMDTRHLITGRIEHKIAKDIFLGARATWMDEESDRLAVGDEDEESSYGRWQAFLTITAKF